MTPEPSIIRLSSEGYRTEPWRNGQGITREIARFPQQDQWDWRLSIATIAADSAFSRFPGVDRRLLLLSGNGLRLRFADGEVVQLDPPHGAAAFAGEREVVGELIDGPTDDFNLMWNRERIEADCWLRPLVGTGVLAQAPQEQWAVHLIAGRFVFADAETTCLNPGDTAIVRDSAQRRMIRYEGEGTALLIRLRSKT